MTSFAKVRKGGYMDYAFINLTAYKEPKGQQRVDNAVLFFRFLGDAIGNYTD
jgi:hypothetical protein